MCGFFLNISINKIELRIIFYVKKNDKIQYKPIYLSFSEEKSTQTSYRWESISMHIGVFIRT